VPGDLRVCTRCAEKQNEEHELVPAAEVAREKPRDRNGSRERCRGARAIVGSGPDLSTLFRRSVAMVDQILMGSRPEDIPIGEPQKFDAPR
jgi:hypothetical protein